MGTVERKEEGVAWLVERGEMGRVGRGKGLVGRNGSGNRGVWW